MLKIFSHPRSGTHFLEAFIGQNFYPDKDLSVKNLSWGHWSNRKTKESNQYGKLFGGHGFPKKNLRLKPSPILYIYRDGRAVAYSIWKTPNFLNKEMSKLSFSEFLRTPLDWEGTPGKPTDKKRTIVEHWVDHVDSWRQLKGNILHISYEELFDEPQHIYSKVLWRCFPYRLGLMFGKRDVKVIKNPLGLLPNRGTKDSWKEIFNEDDLHYFNSKIPVYLRQNLL